MVLGMLLIHLSFEKGVEQIKKEKNSSPFLGKHE
jgi:hypothetical protein